MKGKSQTGREHWRKYSKSKGMPTVTRRIPWNSYEEARVRTGSERREYGKRIKSQKKDIVVTCRRRALRWINQNIKCNSLVENNLIKIINKNN